MYQIPGVYPDEFAKFVNMALTSSVDRVVKMVDSGMWPIKPARFTHVTPESVGAKP